MVKILNNTQKQGIELYFDIIPQKTIINALKENNFKWHSMKKCWYAKATEQAKAFINNLQEEKINTTEQNNTNITTITNNYKKKEKEQEKVLQLKSLRLATEQEKEQIITEQYDTKHMQDFLRKQYDYYLTQDNYILEFEKASVRRIDKTMYYDDEYDSPQINYTNFENYNRHNGTLHELERFNKNFDKDYEHFMLTYNHSEKICFIHIVSNWELEENKTRYKYFRELTREEQEDYKAILEDIQAKYITRLQKYYNKYGKHITTYGYWANR